MIIKAEITKKLKLSVLTFAALLCNLEMQSQDYPITDQWLERLLVEQGIDTNGNTGDILVADALKVKTLTIRDHHIKSIKSLESFINLTHLTVEGDSIESLLDFDFAKNLISLDLRGVAAKHLDLQTNRELISISLENCRNLRQLSLANNLKLKQVSLINLGCEELDLSLNSNLKRIHIVENKFLKFLNIANGNHKDSITHNMVDINLRENTALEVMLVDHTINGKIGKSPYGYAQWKSDYAASMLTKSPVTFTEFGATLRKKNSGSIYKNPAQTNKTSF